MRNKYRGPDIQARLHGTFIRYKGIPYYCTVVGEILELHTIPNRTLHSRIEADDIFLDISSIRLGYVNYDRGLCASYLKRIPFRRYKQGIDRDSVHAVNLLPREYGNPYQGGDVLLSKGFVEMCADVYPRLEQALKSMTVKDKNNNVWLSVALSRDIALKKVNENLEIYVKQDCVGWISLKDRSVRLATKENAWLYRSMLEKVGIVITHEGL